MRYKFNNFLFSFEFFYLPNLGTSKYLRSCLKDEDMISSSIADSVLLAILLDTIFPSNPGHVNNKRNILNHYEKCCRY